MKRPVRTLILSAGSAALLALLWACASQPVVIPDGLTATEIFQRAQDAADRGDYALGIRYYSRVPVAYPDDVNHVTWASYEIAFLYHKMGKDETALSLINDLLSQYEKERQKLPPAPHVLAVKLKARLEAAAAQQPPKK